jgi:hypothetical protein
MELSEQFFKEVLGKIYFGLSHSDHHEEINWMEREFWSYGPTEIRLEAQELFPAVLSAADLFFLA